MSDSIHPDAAPIAIPRDVDDVEYAQSLRKQLVSQILHGGKIPQDNKELNSLIKLIDGVAKTSLDKQKVAVEEKNASSSSDVARASLALLNKFGIHNPYEKAPLGPIAAPTADLDQLPEIQTVPGEKDVSPRDWSRHSADDEQDPEDD